MRPMTSRAASHRGRRRALRRGLLSRPHAWGAEPLCLLKQRLERALQVRERGSPRTAANPKKMGGRRGKGGKRRGAPALAFCGVDEGLTLDEYVGAASTEHHVSTPGPQSPLKSPLRAAPSPPKRRSPLKPRSALLPPLSKGERRPKSNKSVRFTPGTAGSVLSSDDEPEDVPDPSKIWALPPPRKFDYEWRFHAPAKVLVHGVDINARPGPVAELNSMNPVVAPNQVSLAEMRRRWRRSVLFVEVPSLATVASMAYDDVAPMAYVVVRCDDRPSTRSAQAPRRADAPDAPDAVAALARPRAARALRAERHVPVSHALVEPPVEEGPDPVRFPRPVFFVCARRTPRPADLHAAMACTARRHRATPRQRSRYTQAEREAQEGAHHARVGPRGRPRGEHHGRERAARARPGRHARPAEGTHADDRVAVASADGAEEVSFAFVR